MCPGIRHLGDRNDPCCIGTSAPQTGLIVPGTFPRAYLATRHSRESPGHTTNGNRCSRIAKFVSHSGKLHPGLGFGVRQPLLGSGGRQRWKGRCALHPSLGHYMHEMLPLPWCPTLKARHGIQRKFTRGRTRIGHLSGRKTKASSNNGDHGRMSIIGDRGWQDSRDRAGNKTSSIMLESHVPHYISLPKKLIRGTHVPWPASMNGA